MEQTGLYAAKTHLPQLLNLARRFELSVYDTASLETALRRNSPPATLDRRMREAAEKLGIALLHVQDWHRTRSAPGVLANPLPVSVDQVNT